MKKIVFICEGLLYFLGVRTIKIQAFVRPINQFCDCRAIPLRVQFREKNLNFGLQLISVREAFSSEMRFQRREKGIIGWR